jgi:hypothetical protein
MSAIIENDENESVHNNRQYGKNYDAQTKEFMKG